MDKFVDAVDVERIHFISKLSFDLYNSTSLQELVLRLK